MKKPTRTMILGRPAKLLMEKSEMSPDYRRTLGSVPEVYIVTLCKPSVAPQSPTMLPPPLRPPPPVDTDPQQRSDMRPSLVANCYVSWQANGDRKALFLGMVADAQSTYGEISDSKLAEKVVIAWRDAHYDLI
jgi:hypothetical protein